MKTLRITTIVLATLAVLFVAGTLVASAAGEASVSPVSAPYIDSQTHSIAPDSTSWFRFDYAVSHSAIQITLPNGAVSGLAFEVMTSDQAADWWEATPVGRGSPNGNDLVWAGSFNNLGTYYVEVVNNTTSGMPFQLAIQGTGVMVDGTPPRAAGDRGGRCYRAPECRPIARHGDG